MFPLLLRVKYFCSVPTALGRMSTSDLQATDKIYVRNPEKERAHMVLCVEKLHLILQTGKKIHIYCLT